MRALDDNELTPSGKSPGYRNPVLINKCISQYPDGAIGCFLATRPTFFPFLSTLD